MKSSSCSAVDASWASPELTNITATPTTASSVSAVECHTPDSMDCKLATMARSCPPAPRRLRTMAARRKRSSTETELSDVGMEELERLFRRRDRLAAVVMKKKKKRRRVAFMKKAVYGCINISKRFVHAGAFNATCYVLDAAWFSAWEL